MGLVQKVIELELILEGYVPLTPVGIVARHLNRTGKLVLDLGCGQGQPAYALKRHNHKLIGLDGFRPYLDICFKNQNHWGLVRADVRWLPFRPKSVDSVVGIRLLEHLKRDEAEQLIEAAETCADKQVIFSLPVASFERPAYHNNPFQAHQSAWMPQEFRERGYRVYGSGLRWLNALRLRIPEFTRFLLDAVWVLVSPISYYWPEVAGHMVCVKNLDWESSEGRPIDVL